MAIMLPMLIQAGLGMIRGGGVARRVGLTEGQMGGAIGALTRGGRRRRRRGSHGYARQKNDLMFVKETVGKTAAAQYLALLRGR